MKILWLYRYIPDYNFDHWLHMGYARSIQLQTDIAAYGPRLRELYADITPLDYSPEFTVAKLHELLHFDIIIANTKSRCFFDYNPKTDTAQGMWLPEGFSSWKKTPKVIIEEDYHYEKDDSWYKQMGFDLIIQRHYSQSLRQQNVPMVFLPFSVDTCAFNDIAKCDRKRKLAFMGSNQDAAYTPRRTATDLLCDANLCENHSSRLREANYTNILQRYAGYISCGSTYEIVAAKNFEIMASGGVLFTNKFKGIDLVFPPDTYCSYENDYSDVVSKGLKIVEDIKYCKTTTEKAMQCILTRHTHAIRTEEMLQVFRERFHM